MIHAKLAETLVALDQDREALDILERGQRRFPDSRRFTSVHAQLTKRQEVESGFQVLPGARFRLRFEGQEQQALAERVLEILEAHHTRLSSLLWIRPSEPLAVILDTDEQYHHAVDVPEWSKGVFDGKTRIRGASDLKPERLEALVTHELIHAFFGHALVRSGAKLPGWFNEGFATALEPRPRTTTRWLHLLQQEGMLLDDRTLAQPFLTLDQRRARIAYLQAQGLAERLIAQHGAGVAYKVLQHMNGGETFDEAFRLSTYTTVEAFLAAPFPPP